jgi:hypothetical protein
LSDLTITDDVCGNAHITAAAHVGVDITLDGVATASVNTADFFFV